MAGLLPSMVVLGLAAFAALALALSRRPRSGQPELRQAVVKALAVAVTVQAVHFLEELATGFNERVPAVFDLPAMPLSFFVLFNLGWIVIWLGSIPGVQSGKTFAYFAAWFLAIAGTLNGILHPLLAINDGSYFPGLYSSPVICAASIWLWLRLKNATSKVAT